MISILAMTTTLMTVIRLASVKVNLKMRKAKSTAVDYIRHKHLIIMESLLTVTIVIKAVMIITKESNHKK